MLWRHARSFVDNPSVPAALRADSLPRREVGACRQAVLHGERRQRERYVVASKSPLAAAATVEYITRHKEQEFLVPSVKKEHSVHPRVFGSPRRINAQYNGLRPAARALAS
jgi:hypothetical protein